MDSCLQLDQKMVAVVTSLVDHFLDLIKDSDFNLIDDDKEGSEKKIHNVVRGCTTCKFDKCSGFQ